MEVLFDLDVEAREQCASIGLHMERSKAAGNHPLVISMIRELIEERLYDDVKPRSVGRQGPVHHVCPRDCCMPTRRP
jgi:ferrochelatase